MANPARNTSGSSHSAIGDFFTSFFLTIDRAIATFEIDGPSNSGFVFNPDEPTRREIDEEGLKQVSSRSPNAAGTGAVAANVTMMATAPEDAPEVLAATKGRIFTSIDPLVGELATKIDAAYPGHVLGVNVPIRDASGKLVTDADILLRNSVVQVKSGGGKGLTSQLQRTEQATGLPTIGYGPDLKPSVLRGCAATNCERTLIEVVKP